jgi:hypothetical protein
MATHGAAPFGFAALVGAAVIHVILGAPGVVVLRARLDVV